MSFTLFPLEKKHLPASAQLESLVFGPGRFARTAYRVREYASAVDKSGYGAFMDESNDRLIGCVHLTRIFLRDIPGTLLGPLCVHPEGKNRGLGKALVHQSIAASWEADRAFVLLVGDYAYYKVFGFCVAEENVALLPGPVDQNRRLILKRSPSLHLPKGRIMNACAHLRFIIHHS